MGELEAAPAFQASFDAIALGGPGASLCQLAFRLGSNGSVATGAASKLEIAQKALMIVGAMIAFFVFFLLGLLERWRNVLQQGCADRLQVIREHAEASLYRVSGCVVHVVALSCSIVS